MLIYLDTCCFNRPYDDQMQINVRLETEAKLSIQEHVKRGNLDLAWSFILDYEIAQNPFPERRLAIHDWRGYACRDVAQSAKIVHQAKMLTELLIQTFDALHVACAMQAGCQYFITADKRLIQRLKHNKVIHVVNPVRFVMEVL